VTYFLTSHAFLHGLCLPIGIIDDAIIELLRTHNKRIATYTCNSDADINKALNFGVDELITDDPVKALAMRADCLC
jgi:glycerophosphoryl diester phosphodiesterase